MRKFFFKFEVFVMVAAVFFVFYGNALADTMGQQVNFYVNSGFDKNKRATLDATLRHIGERAYFYVDNGYWAKLDISHQNSLLANISALSQKFDSSIYPTETSVWGSEPNPGVDGEPKITILLEELVDNNGGYFETGNSYTLAQIDNSNQREMIALNAEVLNQDLATAVMFLAHEFQHMISFNQKEKLRNSTEEVWLNELRSEYSISLTGLNDVYENSNLHRRVHVFSGNQSDSLTEWQNKNPDYAMVALFAEYLVEQYGHEVLSQTMSSPLHGISSINEYLGVKGRGERFNDVFLNWLGALYLNDVSVDPRFGYNRPELKDLKAAPHQRVSLSPSFTGYIPVNYIKDYQPLWIEFDINGFEDGMRSPKLELVGDAGQSYSALFIAYYASGKVETGKFQFLSEKGSAYIVNSPDKVLDKVVVVATKNTKNSGFTQSEGGNNLNAKIYMVDTGQARSGALKDGALIKRPREKEIYVIWGKYKRYLNPDVIKLYGHLDPANAIELDPDAFNSYQTSNYVKYVNDERVYAVWPDGTKHWLNISAGQWDSSGRDWNAIFTINDLELNHYRQGEHITR